MKKVKVCIQRLPGNDDIPLPQYMTDQAAGMDIFSAVAEEEIILPGQRKKSQQASPSLCPMAMKRRSGRAADWR